MPHNQTIFVMRLENKMSVNVDRRIRKFYILNYHMTEMRTDCSESISKLEYSIRNQFDWIF